MATSKPPTAGDGSMGIEIRRIETTAMLVPIIGTAPLIVHAWNAKAKQEMLDKQQGRKSVKQHRNPQQEYEESLYYTDKGYGFPVLGFKAATVGAARFYGRDVSMTSLRQFMYWDGTPSRDRSQLLVPITGEPKMREDVVTISQNTRYLRYRGEFLDWTAVLHIRYARTSLGQDSVLSLVEAGGMGVGVGEWRPEKDGLNGTYRIDPDREILTVDE